MFFLGALLFIFLVVLWCLLTRAFGTKLSVMIDKIFEVFGKEKNE